MRRTGLPVLGLVGLWAWFLWGSPSFAQEVKDKRVGSLADRQDKARKELNKLLQRIREIAERLRNRGEEHQARKLEEAFRKIQEVGLLADMRAVIQTLRSARLWEAIDQQKEIVGKIDKVLDILLDRKSFEELEKNAEALNRIENKINDLIKEETKHIDKLGEIEREGRKNIPEDVKAAARAVDDLMAAQRALMQRTKAADMGENLKHVDKAIADLEKLTAEQEDLLERIRKIEGLTQEEARLLDGALKMLEDLAAMQDRAAEAAAYKGETPDLDAMAEALKAIRKEQEALEAANKGDAAKSGKTGLYEAHRQLQDLMDRQRSLKELTRAAGELDSILKKQEAIASRAGEDPEWAKEQAGAQGKAADRARQIAGNLKRRMEDPDLSTADREGTHEAAEAVLEAKKALEAASRAAEKGGEAASRSAKEALEALKKASQALAPVLGEGWKKLREAQKELTAQAKTLAEAVAPPPEKADTTDPEARAKRAGASAAILGAGEKMEKAQEKLGEMRSGEATGRQSEALGKLHTASRLIGEILEGATPEGQGIADRQWNLGKKTAELGKNLKGTSRRKPLGEKGRVGKALKKAGKKAADAANLQEAAAGHMLRGGNHEAGMDQKKAARALDEASKALDDAMRKAGGKAGREDLAETQAATAKGAAAVGKNVSKAAKTLKSRGAEGRGGRMAKLADAVSKAAKAAQEAGEASKKGAMDRAAERSREAKDALSKARDELADFLRKSQPRTDEEAKEQAKLRDEASRLAKAMANLGRNNPTMPGRREAKEASRSVGDAGRKMSEAAQRLNDASPREAEVKQEQALKKLKEAREKAEGLRKRLLDKSEPAREEVAKQQRRLKEDAEKVKEMLEKLEQKRSSGGASPSSGKKASSAMGQAKQNMKKAEENLVKRNFPKAKESQQNALKSMEEARREVKKLEDQAIRKAKERELNALVREQAATKEKTELTKEELEKLKRLMEARQMDQAARAMNQAKHKVSKMELRPGKEKMEEARDYLQEAGKAVREQQRRYQALAQEQLIFQIKTLLKDVVVEQRKINGLVEEMGSRVDAGRRLQRGHLRRILQGADNQADLAKRMKEIEKKIEKEAKVFAWVVQSTVEDMNAIADLLRDRPPDVGPFTRGLGREVE
ncbi:MAG: coiled-coil domain-containing protein, partial [Planctomycetota bacterium]